MAVSKPTMLSPGVAQGNAQSAQRLTSGESTLLRETGPMRPSAGVHAVLERSSTASAWRSLLGQSAQVAWNNFFHHCCMCGWRSVAHQSPES